jgi:helicase
MRIEALEAYDIEPQIIDTWRATVGERLPRCRSAPSRSSARLGDDNMVVFSPTNSGKTFIGEMAAVEGGAREHSGLLPGAPSERSRMKSSGSCRSRYIPAGIDVVVSSRDRHEDDAQIRGDRSRSPSWSSRSCAPFW